MLFEPAIAHLQQHACRVIRVSASVTTQNLVDHRGCRYEGEYENGLMHGQGVFRSENEGVYEGGFKNGMKDGQGKWEV